MCAFRIMFNTVCISHTVLTTFHGTTQTPDIVENLYHCK